MCTSLEKYLPYATACTDGVKWARQGELGQTGLIGTFGPIPKQKNAKASLILESPGCSKSPHLSQFTLSVPILDFATDAVVYTALFSY